MRTLLDLRGNIPSFIRITDGKVHDVYILDELIPEAGAFYIMDRGYVAFARLHLFTLNQAFFVIRAKSNLQFRRLYSHPIDKSTGLKCDQTIVLTGYYQKKDYPAKHRRVRYFDAETKKDLTFLTNNFSLPALVPKLRDKNLQISLAKRVILQVDQATFADKSIFWNVRKCC